VAFETADHHVLAADGDSREGRVEERPRIASVSDRDVLIDRDREGACEIDRAADDAVETGTRRIGRTRRIGEVGLRIELDDR